MNIILLPVVGAVPAQVTDPVHLDAILEELHSLEHGGKVMDILRVPLTGRESKHTPSPWWHMNLQEQRRAI